MVFFNKSKEYHHSIPNSIPNETGTETHRDDKTTISKNHIEKVMFLCAVGVPQIRPDGTYFDGKIALIPIIEKKPAICSSNNKLVGTEVIKCLSVDATKYYQCMTEKEGILDKIKEKMYWLRNEDIIIQHDGATPHNGKLNDTKLAMAGYEDDWNIKFITQPPQSADLNKLDLCLFHSMNSDASRIRGNGKDLESLINSVDNIWKEYEPATLERSDALLYEVYRKILENEGNNQYKIPHTGIREHQEKGERVIDDFVSRDLYLFGLQTLKNLDNTLNVDDGLITSDSDEENPEDNGPL